MFAEQYRDHDFILVGHVVSVDAVDIDQAGLEVVWVFALPVGFIGVGEQGARHGALGGAPVVCSLDIPDLPQHARQLVPMGAATVGLIPVGDQLLLEGPQHDGGQQVEGFGDFTDTHGQVNCRLDDRLLGEKMFALDVQRRH
ncbi:hypothetical protein [Pseudomonas sp. 22 E 5]|nr:hypothetical protein [Pseudomonas sp. 22 E 5]